MSARLSQEVMERLDLHALGLLEGAELAEIEALLGEATARGEAARAALGSAEQALGALALPDAPQEVGEALKGRLMAQLDPSARFEPFVEQIARLVGLGAQKVRELLGWIEEPGRWEEGPSETSRLLHLPYGPSVAASNVGFVWVKAGARFPVHTHLGRETVLVLQGGLREDDGAVLRRGGQMEAQDGSAHGFEALEGADLIYLVVLESGVLFEGMSFEL
jgi:putative transcriptional regulator